MHLVRFECRRDGRMESIRRRVPEGTTLLDAVREAGLPMAQACEAGGLCARCDVTLLEGALRVSAESALERVAKERNRVPATRRLACQCRIHGPVAITASYW